MNQYPQIKNELCVSLQNIAKKTVRKKIVLFFGRDSFSDNTKYLYLHMVSHAKDIECIWCSSDEKTIAMLKEHQLPCHHIGKDMLKTVDLFMKAAVSVFCVNPHQSLARNWYFYSCLSGTVKIQLWHGISVKKLLLQLIPYLNITDMEFNTSLSWASDADYIISTSEQLDSYWHEVFGCDKIIRAGYPRNEVITREATENELLGSQLNAHARKALTNGRKKILFTPTWQRFKNTQLFDTQFLTRLLAYTKKNKIDVFMKTHPSYMNSFNGHALKIENFYYIDADVDLYPYFRHFDALLTDYSSIMFDFLLTGNPILTLDLDQEKHENFEPDYSLLPCADDYRYIFIPENIETVLNTALNKDTKKEAREKAVSAIFTSDTTKSSESLMYKIEEITNQKIMQSEKFTIV